MTESARLVIAVDSRQVGQAQSAMDSLGRASSLVSKAVSAVGPALGVRELYQATEAYASIANRMRLVTEGAVELRAAQDAVFQSAQTARQPLAATAELYQRIAANQKALNLSGKGVASITDTISKSLAISGASAASANAALIQLGQAFASGTLRGEELNSVMEQAPALSQAIAAGMGVTIGQLRSLGAEGKLTAEAVVKALQNQADAVDEKFNRIANTVGGALQVAGNTLTRFVGELDQASGATSTLADGIIGASKFVDKFTEGSEALSTSLTVVGTAMTIAAGRVAGGYAQQGAAALYAANANRVALNAAAATAKQDLISAQSKQVDAKATLEVMTLNLSAAEAKVASDRVVMASEVSRIKMVQSALASELALEQERMKSQISEAGRAATVARMVEIRGAQVLINKQVEASERTLAATTVASSAQVQAAYAKVTAAKAGVLETTVAVNAAVAASDRATAAASTFAGAGKAVLGLLGGPLGLVFTVGAVAASYFMFRDGAKDATSALVDQNLTVSDSIAKFRELRVEQQRLMASQWAKDQKEATESAAKSLENYTRNGILALNSLGNSGINSVESFKSMMAEVGAGTRSFDSVTAWLTKNNQLLPAFKDNLEKVSVNYGVSSASAKKLGEQLSQVGGATNTVTAETGKLTAVQAAASKSNGANAGDWDKYISKLTETRDLIGANSAAEAEYNAIKMGASVEQRSQAKLIGEQTVVLKALQEAVKDGDKVEQAALKTKLLGLYTAEEAAKQAAATQKQAYADTATAAEESAKRQAAAFMAVVAASYAPVMANPNPKKLSGYGLLTNGGTPPAVVPEVPETALERYERAIKLINEGTEVNKKTDKAANAAAKAIENQAKALKDFEAQSAISTKSSNDMADAYLSGADNIRELAIQQEIEQEVLKTGALSYDKVKEAVNALHDAKDREDVAKNIDDLRRETTNTLAQATATLQGADALETFNIQKSMSIALSGKKIDIGSKEYEQLLEQTKAQLAANKALEQASKVEGIIDRLNPQIKLLKDYTAERDALNAAMIRDSDNVGIYQDALAKLGNEYEVNRSKATIWGQMTEGAIDRIDEAFASAWGNIGSGAESLWDNLKKGFKQTLGEIAHMLTTKPLLASISNWLTGTDNGQGVSSVWGKLLGSVGGAGGAGGAGTSDSSGWGGMVGLGKNLYSAWSNLTGVGSSIASGYASGGIGGAISGGAGYYGNMLSSLGSTLSSGFSSLVSTITGTTAAQTAATIGAQGITSGVLSGAVAEGATAIGAQFSTGVATTTAATYAAAEAGAAATAASLGGQISAAVSSAAAMWPLAVIMGMYQSGKLYDAGVRPDAGEIRDSAGSTTLGKVAMAPGAAMSGFFEAQDKALSKVVGGKWAAILSGSTLHQAVTKMVGEKLFGTGYQTKDTGLALGVTGGVFDAQSYQDQKKKGGWLSGSSKSRTLYGALPTETMDVLGAAYNDTVFQVGGLFSTLGVELSDSVLDGLNMAQFKISTKDKTQEEVQAQLDAWFGMLGTQAVSAISEATNAGLGAFTFEGLKVFVQNLQDVNSIIGHLNIGLYDMSVSGGFMAEQLSAWAGGIEALRTSTAGYYDKFYTDAEKAANTLSDVRKEFENLGLTLPESRQGYRDMVEGIDKTTEVGRAMFLTLMNLSGDAAQAFTILEANANSASQALTETLNAAVTGAMGAVQRAVSAEKDAATKAYNDRVSSLNDMVSTATENVSGLTSVGNDLSAALKALRGDSDDAVKMLRAQAQATLQSALATARSGGSLSGFTGLSDALDTVSNNNTDLYSSMEDFARDQGRTANVVAELNIINGKQLTTEEQLLSSVKDQVKQAKEQFDEEIARLDLQLELAQTQVDALNGVNNSVLSVKDAIAGLGAAISAAMAAKAAATVATGEFTGTAGAPSASDLNAVYNSVLGRDVDPSGAAHWAGQLGSGAVTPAGLAAAIKADALKNGELAAYATGGLITGPGTGTSDSIFARLSNGEYVMSADAVRMFGTGLLDQMNAGQLPAFAMGGGVGETGPQLEVTGPSRIFNSNQARAVRGSTDSGATAAEIREFRREMESNATYMARLTKSVADGIETLVNSGVQILGTVETKAATA